MWTEAQLVGQDGGHITVQTRMGQTRLSITSDLGGEVSNCNPHNLVCQDMTGLHHIHEPAIMHNLKQVCSGENGIRMNIISIQPNSMGRGGLARV